MAENKKNARQSFAPGALTAPLPPTLVTVGEGDRANIITIGWTGILCTIPPKTYISVRESRHSHGLLKEFGEFVINLPSADLAREVDYAGIYTGAKVDKFEKCKFTKVDSQEIGAPTIGECPIAIECRVTDVISYGSHDCFVADIVAVSCREDILDEGRICYDKANLLAYAHGEYFALGKSLGRFGFSAAKPNKTNAKAEKSAISKPGDKRAEAVKVAQVKKAKTPHGKVDRKDVGKPGNHKKRVTGANKTKGNGAK
jgi:flavin reductase (DIM6/NTAB) family NADH-FMN oxidoreductase RutF